MHFEKVSFNRWAKDIDVQGVDAKTLLRWYESIKLPKQGSAHSMGVDFFTPYPINVLPHNKCKIATGIRWICDEPDDKNYGMMIFPRSGLGCKGFRLLSTTGVIDADYYLSVSNEGDIHIIFENYSDDVMELPQGKAIAQGIIMPYKIPDGAESNEQRNGGFGSTDNTSGHV